MDVPSEVGVHLHRAGSAFEDVDFRRAEWFAPKQDLEGAVAHGLGTGQDWAARNRITKAYPSKPIASA